MPADPLCMANFVIKKGGLFIVQPGYFIRSLHAVDIAQHAQSSGNIRIVALLLKEVQACLCKGSRLDKISSYQCNICQVPLVERNGRLIARFAGKHDALLKDLARSFILALQES